MAHQQTTTTQQQQQKPFAPPQHHHLQFPQHLPPPPQHNKALQAMLNNIKTEQQQNHLQLQHSISLKQEREGITAVNEQPAQSHQSRMNNDRSYASGGEDRSSHASTGKSSSKRKTVNPMILDNGHKVTKLLQTPFKAIRIASGAKAKQDGTDADLALFLAHLQTKIRDGLPRELVNQSIAQFAEQSNISKELINEFLAKTQAEYCVTKNAERLATGHKFKGIAQSQLPFAPITTDKLSLDELKPATKRESKVSKEDAAKKYTVNPLTDRAENIFIDEDLQMTCPQQPAGQNLASKMAHVKVEPLNNDFLADEESTRSNLALLDKKIESSLPPPPQQQPKKKGKQGSKKEKQLQNVKKAQPMSDDSDSLFDFLELHETSNLARIPKKTNLQQVIEQDDQTIGQQQQQQHGGVKLQQMSHLTQQQKQEMMAAAAENPQENTYCSEEELIEEYENTINYDFCQHPKASQFLLSTLRYQVSMEDSCHINSVMSAQQVGQMALQYLCKPGFKIERLTVLQVLIQTKNQTILKGFIRGGGLQAIYHWLEFLVDYRYEVEKTPSLLEQQILQRILIVLSKLQLTVDILKQIKVGKLVNSVRLHPNAGDDIRSQAEVLIGQWKQLVVDYKKRQQQTLAAHQQSQEQAAAMQQPSTILPPSNPMTAMNPTAALMLSQHTQQQSLQQVAMMAPIVPPLPIVHQIQKQEEEPPQATIQLPQPQPQLPEVEPLETQTIDAVPPKGTSADNPMKQLRRSNVLSLFNSIDQKSGAGLSQNPVDDILPESAAAALSKTVVDKAVEESGSATVPLTDKTDLDKLALEKKVSEKLVFEKPVLDKTSSPGKTVMAEKKKSNLKKRNKADLKEKQVSFLEENTGKKIPGFEKFTQEGNEDVLMSDEAPDEEMQIPLSQIEEAQTKSAPKTPPLSLSQQERADLDDRLASMTPLLDYTSYVQTALPLLQGNTPGSRQREQTSSKSATTTSETEQQLNREKFIADVSNPEQMDTPVVAIQGQTEDNFKPLVTCDLSEVQVQGDSQKEEKEKTDQILSKLLHILETDPDSIVENKDVFTQILAAVDKETIQFIFRAPKIKKQGEFSQPAAAPQSISENKKLAEAVQLQLYQMIMCHYLSCNPILGDYAIMEQQWAHEKDKETFFKQAKEFFFTQPFKSPTPQKQYLTQSQNQADLMIAKAAEAAAQSQIQNPIVPGGSLLSQSPQNLQGQGLISQAHPQLNVINPSSLQQQPTTTQSATTSANIDNLTLMQIQQLQQPLQMQQFQQLQQQPNPGAAQQLSYFNQGGGMSVAPGFDQQQPQSAAASFDMLSQMAQQQPQAPRMMPNSFSSFIGGHHQGGGRPKNYRTVPCRMYHGIQGCLRGDTCHFIHDPAYQGQEIPRDVLLRIRHDNLQKFQTGQLSGIPVYQPGQQPQFNFPMPSHFGSNGGLDQGAATSATVTASSLQQQMQPAPEQQQLQQQVEQLPQPDLQQQLDQNPVSTAADQMAPTTQQHQQSAAYAQLIKYQQDNSPQSTPHTLITSPSQLITNPNPMITAVASGGAAASQVPPSQFEQMLGTQQQTQQQPQMSSSFAAAMQSHPYFNPQFTQQYYQQQEIYKQQQQAQLMASINQGESGDAPNSSTANENGGLNLGSIGMGGMVTQSSQQQPSQQSVDYQLKLLQDKKTQETHRKLLEQIKSDKEKRKNRYLEKYSRKLDGYTEEVPSSQQQHQMHHQAYGGNGNQDDHHHQQRMGASQQEQFENGKNQGGSYGDHQDHQYGQTIAGSGLAQVAAEVAVKPEQVSRRTKKSRSRSRSPGNNNNNDGSHYSSGGGGASNTRRQLVSSSSRDRADYNRHNGGSDHGGNGYTDRGYNNNSSWQQSSSSSGHYSGSRASNKTHDERLITWKEQEEQHRNRNPHQRHSSSSYGGGHHQDSGYQGGGSGSSGGYPSNSYAPRDLHIERAATNDYNSSSASAGAAAAGAAKDHRRYSNHHSGGTSSRGDDYAAGDSYSNGNHGSGRGGWQSHQESRKPQRGQQYSDEWNNDSQSPRGGGANSSRKDSYQTSGSNTNGKSRGYHHQSSSGGGGGTGSGANGSSGSQSRRYQSSSYQESGNKYSSNSGSRASRDHHKRGSTSRNSSSYYHQ